MTHRIPRELQELPQWVIADMTLNAKGEPSKAPLTPSNGREASVTDSSTWSTFEAALKTGQPVGFVLAASDPYTIIDLDDPFKRADASRIAEGDPDYEDALQRVGRHAKILQLFDSYTEVSQSGQGMHIIVRGTIPSGRRKDKVEVYSGSRYMICTGNVYHDAPIENRQELLDILYAEMTTTNHVEQLPDVESTLGDEEVCRMAMSASNADKFNRLCRGEWAEMGIYESQSEADLALMTILAYYTRDNQQAIRLFRYSALGKRDKALRDEYFIGQYGMLNKIRAKQPPLMDLSQLTLPSHLAEPAGVTAPSSEPEVVTEITQIAAANNEISFPPGLLGEIAEFHMTYNVRPMREAALAAAIGLTAGIIGRSYNISNQGLNQYVIVIAGTGTGKEGSAQTIDALTNAVRSSVPMVDSFMGPGEFGSGQGINRWLTDNPCFVSVLGEFGITLQQITRKTATNPEIAIEKALLKLYGTTGFHQTLKATAYSDKEKNTKVVQAPNVTLLGESTPDKFYANLSEDQISSGLIPRFLTLNYEGPRPPANEKAFGPPSPGLVAKLVDLATIAVTTQQNNTCAHVQEDSAARAKLRAFRDLADSKMDGLSDGLAQIWNRAHLKALKLAALVAVGCNPHAPIITEVIADWAIALIHKDAIDMLNKFSSGAVGRGHNHQFAVIGEMMKAYLDMPVKTRRSYKAPEAVLQVQLVPLSFMTNRVRQLKAFDQLNKTPRQVLEQILKEMVELEVINQVPVDQALLNYKTRMPLYSPGANW